MPTKIVWQQNSNEPNNASNFATIATWWKSLNGQEIVWQQRMIPHNGDSDNIDWEFQRFDEKLILQLPEVRGLTLFWYKPNTDIEHNITVKKLELDTARQKLYIYSQAQAQLIVRISKPEVIYQTIELKDPLIVGAPVGDNCVLLLRDRSQQIEIKLTLSREGIGKLLENLPG